MNRGPPSGVRPSAGQAKSLRLTRGLGLAGVRPWLVIASTASRSRSRSCRSTPPARTSTGWRASTTYSRNLIRIWVAKSESGEFDPDIEAATLLGDYEAKIVALERMVGRQALEIEFLKGALQQGRLPRSAPMSVIAGPVVSRSLKDAG